MRPILAATFSLLLPAWALAAELPSLDDRIAAVLPKPSEERWLQIPWRLDFAAARAEANDAAKPLFLWMMDGHPLGCT